MAQAATAARSSPAWRVLGLLAWLPLALVLAALLADLVSLHRWQRPSRLPELETWLRERETDHLLSDPAFFGGPEEAPATVWIAGGSSVVLPDPTFVATTISEALAAQGASVRVANLGRNGADLAQVAARFEGVLTTNPPPDVLILYTGHNDVLAAHHFFGTIRPMRWTTLITYAVSLLRHGRDCDACSWQDDYDWYRRNQAAAWLDAAQALHLWTPDPDYWTRFDALVLAAFERRLEKLLRRTEALGVQLVLETPVGNLDVVPRGFRAGIHALRNEAANAPDLASRTRLLQAAQDLELYSPDLRATSALHARLHAVGAAHGVPVFDLGQAFVTAGVPRDDTLYFDAFHYHREGHLQHFALLAPWLMAQPEVAARLRPPAQASGGALPDATVPHAHE